MYDKCKVVVLLVYCCMVKAKDLSQFDCKNPYIFCLLKKANGQSFVAFPFSIHELLPKKAVIAFVTLDLNSRSQA